jgi:hypothetical protein
VAAIAALTIGLDDLSLLSALVVVVLVGMVLLSPLAFSIAAIPVTSHRAMHRRLSIMLPLTFIDGDLGRYGVWRFLMLYARVIGVLVVVAPILFFAPVDFRSRMIFALGVLVAIVSVVYVIVVAIPSERGNYDVMLRRARWARKRLPMAARQMASFEAMALQKLGNREKSFAEQSKLIKWAFRRPDLAFLSMTLNNVGHHLVLDGEFVKSLPYIEAAVCLEPQNSANVDTLIIWYLEQKTELDRVQELITHIRRVESEAPSEFGLASIKLLTLYTLLSREAYILALQGHPGRAKQVLAQFYNIREQMLPSLGLSNPNGIADALLYAGRAERHIGNRVKARKHFERAVSLEPDGNVGRLARQELQEIGGNTP